MIILANKPKLLVSPKGGGGGEKREAEAGEEENQDRENRRKGISAMFVCLLIGRQEGTKQVMGIKRHTATIIKFQKTWKCNIQHKEYIIITCMGTAGYQTYGNHFINMQM